jgi:hypothetical protein
MAASSSCALCARSMGTKVSNVALTPAMAVYAQAMA